MNENNTYAADFPELADDDFNMDAIFGKAGSGSDEDPFDKPKVKEPPNVPAENVIEAAFTQQTTENARKGLFEKPPVFSYAGAKEEITDNTMTFEELRIAKSEDFPELAEGKRVSWSVEYGKTTKTISDPKSTVIAEVKKEIETSKAFLDSLKKAKEKKPDCLVKPRVTAQTKGLATYRGVFNSLEEARASDKCICLIPAEDGNVYEMRKTELGEFIAPKHNIIDLSTIRAGFSPALPLIPNRLVRQIITFFRCFLRESGAYEALVHIYWDREEQRYVVHVPQQLVSHTRIQADLTKEPLPEERYLHYADVHSHNTMAAKFSAQDDRDELATRLYLVVGRLDRFYPSISARVSCGGIYQRIDPAAVLEMDGEVFPAEWLNRVTCDRTALPLERCWE